MVESNGLLNRRTGHTVPRVRIPLSPPFKTLAIRYIGNLGNFSYRFPTKKLAVSRCLAHCRAVRKSKPLEGPHEYPKGSGIRVNKVSNSKVHGESFRVNVPSKVTGNSRLQKQFKTLGEAHDFAAKESTRSKRHGELAFRLKPEQLVDASKAFDRLKNTGLSLSDVLDFALPKLRPANGRLSVDEAISEFLAVKNKPTLKLAERTLRDYKNRLETFGMALGEDAISEITLKDIKVWFEELDDLTARSRLNYYRAIRSLFKWARRNRLIDDPFDLVDKDEKTLIVGRDDERPPVKYSVKEAILLLEGSIAEEIFPCVVLGLFCGLRTEELCKLEWHHVHFDADDPFVEVPAEIAKGRSIRNVDLCDSALEWLSLASSGRAGRIWPFETVTYFAHRRRLHHECGVQSVNNGMRHSFGSYHFALSGNEMETKRLMGHSPDENTLFKHYRSLTKKEEGKKFFSIRPIKSVSKIVGFNA